MEALYANHKSLQNGAWCAESSRLRETLMRLGDLDLERHLRDAAIKQRYVTVMFDLIAPRYERFTRWFSYGIDRGWKREVVRSVAERVSGSAVILDLGCGTGDLALAVGAERPLATVVGIDISMRMRGFAAARAKRAATDVSFCGGDMMALPVRDASVDAVTVGYGLRNTPDYEQALAEIARILKPGGALVTLDFYRPTNPVWASIFLRYLSLAGHAYGWLWHREPNAYGYIAESVRRHVTTHTLAEALAEKGFEVVRVRRKLLGSIAIHVARLVRRTRVDQEPSSSARSTHTSR